MSGQPELWFEEHLSRIENDAALFLRHLDTLPDGLISNSGAIVNLSIYVALQHQRTPRIRQTNETIEAWNPTGQDPQTAAINYAINVWRKDIVPVLKLFRWWIVSSADDLLTCDEPVIQVGYAEWPRTIRLSFATTALLLFPIGPNRMVIGSPDRGHDLNLPYELTSDETMAVNREIAANSMQYVYERDGASVAEGVDVPPPVDFESADQSNPFLATVLPTRWALISPPPWPLTRWIPPMPTGWRSSLPEIRTRFTALLHAQSPRVRHPRGGNSPDSRGV